MEDITELRSKIDTIDDKIMGLLHERAHVCEAIGKAKKKNGSSVKDRAREGEIFRRVKEKAAELALNPIHVVLVFREIVYMCSSVQEWKEKLE